MDASERRSTRETGGETSVTLAKAPASFLMSVMTDRETTKVERFDMLRALILAAGLASVVAVTARAEDDQKPEKGKRPKLTEEQKALRKEIVDKYDKDKDGKLSQEERKTISAEDREKMQKGGIGGPRRKKAE